MSSRSILSSQSTEAIDAPPPEHDRAAESLRSLFALAEKSPTLIASRHGITVNGEEREIPSFLLLGERGGGKPIRIAIFAGFEAHHANTVEALASLLTQVTRRPSLARDFALLAYPVVDDRGTDLEARFKQSAADPDVEFFQEEFQRWTFDGIIATRTAPPTAGFHAVVGSFLLATEVVQPALTAAAKSLPPAPQPIRTPPRDQPVSGLRAAAGQRPRPFEIELFIPESATTQDATAGLSTTITEILRRYRAFIAHAQNI